jgi:hypothetical protein
MDGQRCGLCGRPIGAGEAHADLVRAGNTAHVACAEAWQRERDAHQRPADCQPTVSQLSDKGPDLSATCEAAPLEWGAHAAAPPGA